MPEMQTRTNRRVQRVGGISSLLAGATFIFGILLYVTVFNGVATSDQTPIEAVQTLIDHEVAMRWWYLVTLVAFGVFIVPLVWALHDRLNRSAPATTRVASTFGCLWAGVVIAGGMVANVTITAVSQAHERSVDEAATLLASSLNIVNGLTGGNEIIGSAWVLALSCAAWSSKALPRQLCMFGMSTSLAGFLTIIPVFSPLAMVYGLSMIGWFFWAGGVLIWYP